MHLLTFARFHKEATAPERAYGKSAAWDLAAFTLNAFERRVTFTVAPRSTALIPTGLSLRPPPGNVILICSRSGLATRSVFVSNAPGVVDPDYVGEIKILLYNGGMEPYYVQHGDRIAQALIVPLTNCTLIESTYLELTERGDRAFGSSGP